MYQTIQNDFTRAFFSPLPGKIVKVLAREGEFVQEGQSVFIVESMKMLHELRAEKSGKMKSISVKEGDLVFPTNHLAYVR
jgi:pyruvate carboxylase